MRGYSVIVIGCSMGGYLALKKILSNLPQVFPIPIVIVQHLGAEAKGIYSNGSIDKTQIHVKEAEDKEQILPGIAYFSPPNYHLLLERNGTLSLSVDEKVNYSRPSIDVLFESAAEVYGSKLVGVILTGANSDGALGLKKIHDEGGLTIVQEPSSAEASEMPASALKLTEPDQILPLEKIGLFIGELKFKNRED